MKVTLTILAGLVILFSGGCALMLMPLGAGLELIPLAVVVLNVLAILALWRNLRSGRWALLILGIIDLLLVLGLALSLGSTAYGGSSELLLIWALVAAFFVKGILSIVFFRRTRESDAATDPPAHS